MEVIGGGATEDRAMLSSLWPSFTVGALRVHLLVHLFLHLLLHHLLHPPRKLPRPPPQKIGPCSLAFGHHSLRCSALSMCREPTTMTGTSSIIRLSGSAGPHNDAGAETDKNTLWGKLEIPTVLRPHRSPYGRQYNGTTKHNCTSSFPDT